MADFIFNIAKGRQVELALRVKNNDPAPSGLVWMLLSNTGIESDAVLQDKDSFADIVSGTTDEIGNSGYSRVVVTDVELSGFTFAPDDTNNRYDIDLPDPNFGNIVTGGTIAKAVLGYDPNTGAGTDADIVPIACFDCTVIPDGSPVIPQLNAAGAFRAS